ncbi:unnamed protein product [Penicillium bialowiezense]
MAPYEAIRDVSYLQFLRRLMPVPDSLDHDENRIIPFLTPNVPILVGRSRRISHPQHEIHPWPEKIASDKCTALTSRATGGQHANETHRDGWDNFLNNLQRRPEMAYHSDKFNILGWGGGRDAFDLWIVEMGIFLDQRTVQTYAALIHVTAIERKVNIFHGHLAMPGRLHEIRGIA